MEKSNKTASSQDANAVINYLRDSSSKVSTVGRSVFFAIIATVWTLSFSNNSFNPSCLNKWSLVLAIIYVFLDLLNYLLTTAVFKYILNNFFELTEEGFRYREGKEDCATICSHIWMEICYWWMIVMSLLLLASSVLLILHVISIK